MFSKTKLIEFSQLKRNASTGEDTKYSQIRDDEILNESNKNNSSKIWENYSSSSFSGTYYSTDSNLSDSKACSNNLNTTNNDQNVNLDQDMSDFKRVYSISSSDLDEIKSDITSPNSHPDRHAFYDQDEYFEAKNSKVKFNDEAGILLMNNRREEGKSNSIEQVHNSFENPSYIDHNQMTNNDYKAAGENDDICSLKRYGIRRHHSAPQYDMKWLQV